MGVTAHVVVPYMLKVCVSHSSPSSGYLFLLLLSFDRFSPFLFLFLNEDMKVASQVRGCIQKFPDWPPGARIANGKALCH
jgi:hypothetical protein